MNVWAVIPVRDFGTAKSRLAPELDAPSRSALAREMFEHVLGVLREASEVTGITVITNSKEIELRAAEAGAVALQDPPHATTLAAIVDHALASVASRGERACVVLMGDLPELNLADIGSVARALDHTDTVLVRDVRGHHTNALGVHLSTRRPTHFGREDSFLRHLSAAADAGADVASLDLPSIAFDVDTREDYARWAAERRRVR